MKNYRSLFGNLVEGEWPRIRAKNASGPGAKDGTPYTDDILNDIWGFMQAAMSKAAISPGGSSESADGSQVLEAFVKIIAEQAGSMLEKNRDCLEWPVGSSYDQRPNDPSPAEKGLPGAWQVWNHRAETYGLSESAPSFSEYKQGGNYAAGSWVLYHVQGSHTHLYQAKAAVSGAPFFIDPVKWERHSPGSRVPRRLVQGGNEGWLEGDLAIGQKIAAGAYSGLVVTEINTPGGTYPAYAGGHRGTFVSAGVEPDGIRNIAGEYGSSSMSLMGAGFSEHIKASNYKEEGALRRRGLHSSYASGTASGSQFPAGLSFSSGRAVPSNAQNSPETVPVLLWMRVR